MWSFTIRRMRRYKTRTRTISGWEFCRQSGSQRVPWENKFALSCNFRFPGIWTEVLQSKYNQKGTFRKLSWINIRLQNVVYFTNFFLANLLSQFLDQRELWDSCRCCRWQPPRLRIQRRHKERMSCTITPPIVWLLPALRHSLKDLCFATLGLA